MTAAEEIRDAAAKLREAASKATPGPWKRETDTDHDGYGANFIANWNGPYLQGVGDTGQGEQADRDAQWIALVSPEIAEPLADLLGSIATEHNQPPCDAAEPCNRCAEPDPIVIDALRLVLALNGDHR